jgi:uncharacterized repeat protein (TIGR01451 family)
MRPLCRPVTVRAVLLILLLALPALSAPAAPASAAPARAAVATLQIVDAPSEVLVGQSFNFTLRFDNNSGETGYGPFVDIFLPTGLTFASATMFDGALSLTPVTGSPFGNNTRHPLFVDITSPPSAPVGQLITIPAPGGGVTVLRLPYGSFTNDQPPVDINIRVNMSPTAVVGSLLTIRARGGFQYGSTPLDDWCCGIDPPVVDPPTSGNVTTWTKYTADITPTLMVLTKTNNAPDSETVTGPNFKRQYTISVDVANGRTVDQLTITDNLPDNIQFVRVVSASSGMTITLPDTNQPGDPTDTLVHNFGLVTGGPGTNDAFITIEFFVPHLLRDGVTPIIAPNTGASVTSNNTVTSEGFWDPAGGTNYTTPVSGSCPGGCPGGVVTDRSIALQKGVTNLIDVAPAGNTPGDTLEYRLDFQVSDFFAFDNLIITDTLGDGQSFDGSFIPTLEIHEQGLSSGPSPMSPANRPPVAPARNPDGTTTLVFNISGEMLARGWDAQLRGGCVNDPPAPINPLCSTGASATGGLGGATGTIIFRAVIDENYQTTTAPPDFDSSVDQADVVNNDAVISGRLIDLTTLNPYGPPDVIVTDGDSTTTQMIVGTLQKTIYAWSTDGGATFNYTSSTPLPSRLSPGDIVTYRLRYTLPSTDTERFRLDDYLPLPIFDAGEITTYDNIPPSPVAPQPGHFRRGPDDTFVATAGLIPTLTAPNPPWAVPPWPTNPDPAGGRVTFYYGTFDGGATTPSVADLLFSVTIRDDPFADGLLLTNQATATESDSFGGTVSSNSIAQFTLGEPALRTEKAIVWTNNAAPVWSNPASGPSPAFLPPASSPRWPGTITNLINTNISNIDAGNIVTFAIFIQNTGSSPKGAFDIRLADILIPQFQMPTTPEGLNLQVAYADGTLIGHYDPLGAPDDIGWRGLGGGPDGTDDTADDIFGNGIELVDPGPANPNYGIGICQHAGAPSGRNLIVVTYDLQVRPGVTPNQPITNTSLLFNYSNREGGTDFTGTDYPRGDPRFPGANPTSTSTVTIRANPAGKTHDIGTLEIGAVYTQTIGVRIPANTNVLPRINPPAWQVNPGYPRPPTYPPAGPHVYLTDRLTLNGARYIQGSQTYLSPAALGQPNCTGTDLNNPAFAAQILTFFNNRTDGETAIWAFPPIDNFTGQDPFNPTDCYFAVTIQVRIEDVDIGPGTQADGRYWLPPTSGAVNLTDQANFLYSDGTTDRQFPQQTDTVRVVEPVMTASKTLLGIFEGPTPPANSVLGTPRTGPAQRLDTVRWSVVLTNQTAAPYRSSATAYEVSFYDTLPLHVAYVPGSAFVDLNNNGTQDTGEDLVTPIITGDATTTPQELVFALPSAYEDIPATSPTPSSVTVVYQAQVLASLPLSPHPTDGYIRRNTADVNWSTMDGSQPNERVFDDRYDEGGIFYSLTRGDGNGDRAVSQFTVIGLSFAKTFMPPAVPHQPPGNVSTLRFTITNPNTIPLTGTAFADTLPSGLTFATPANLIVNAVGANCVGGTVTAPDGGNLLTVNDLTVLPGDCVIDVDVTTDIPGVYTNTTTPIMTNETGLGDTASAVLVVADTLAMHKELAPSPLPPGQVATLTFTLVNGNVSPPYDMVDVEFFEFLPLGSPAGRMAVAPNPNASTSGCGPAAVWNPQPGDISLTFRGGQIPAGGVCVVRVDVVASENATYVNRLDPGNGAALVGGPLDGMVVSGDSLANLDAAFAAGYTLQTIPSDTMVFGGTLVGLGTRQRGVASNASTLIALASPAGPSTAPAAELPTPTPEALPPTGGQPVRMPVTLTIVLIGAGAGAVIAAWVIARWRAAVR